MLGEESYYAKALRTPRCLAQFVYSVKVGLVRTPRYVHLALLGSTLALTAELYRIWVGNALLRCFGWALSLFLSGVVFTSLFTNTRRQNDWEGWHCLVMALINIGCLIAWCFDLD